MAEPAAMADELAAVKLQLEKERKRANGLAEELKLARQQTQATQTALEAEEECVTNKLMKRLSSLQREKQALANAVEQEEEFLSNNLMRKLEAARREKVDLEKALEAEAESMVNKLQAGMRKLEADRAAIRAERDDLRAQVRELGDERTKLKVEKVALEVTLEAEEESIVNKLAKQLEGLLWEKRALERRLEAASRTCSESETSEDEGGHWHHAPPGGVFPPFYGAPAAPSLGLKHVATAAAAGAGRSTGSRLTSLSGGALTSSLTGASLPPGVGGGSFRYGGRYDAIGREAYTRGDVAHAASGTANASAGSTPSSALSSGGRPGLGPTPFTPSAVEAAYAYAHAAHAAAGGPPTPHAPPPTPVGSVAAHSSAVGPFGAAAVHAPPKTHPPWATTSGGMHRPESASSAGTGTGTGAVSSSRRSSDRGSRASSHDSSPARSLTPREFAAALAAVHSPKPVGGGGGVGATALGAAQQASTRGDGAPAASPVSGAGADPERSRSGLLTTVGSAPSVGGSSSGAVAGSSLGTGAAGQ